jgi:hypothetical protein
MYEGFRETLARNKMAMSPQEETELSILLKIAYGELSSPANTQWYSSFSTDLMFMVLDRKLKTWSDPPKRKMMMLRHGID